MIGFDLAQARYDGATPLDVRELSDDPGTDCPGFCEQTDTDDAYVCEDRLSCHLCGGVVCTEHDKVADCGDGPAHEACHRHGCASIACAEDARDDRLMAQDDANHGR